MTQEISEKVEHKIRSTEGLETVTRKLTIMEAGGEKPLIHRFYVTVGYHEGVVSHLDLVCGPSLDYSVRRLISMQCALIRKMLRRDSFSGSELISTWRGIMGGANSFEPQGWCDEIGRMAASPLDAAARWLEKIDE